MYLRFSNEDFLNLLPKNGYQSEAIDLSLIFIRSLIISIKKLNIAEIN
jgi:hypothetical protein